MATWLDVRTEVLHKLQDTLFHPSVGIATATATDHLTIIDTDNLQDSRTNPDAKRYVDMWALLRAGGYTSQTVAEVRKVKTYVPADGKLLVNSAFGGDVLDGAVYELHKFLHPDALLLRANWVMRELRFETLWPVTLVQDGSMEEDMTAALWAETTSTKSKVATCWSGTRSLYVVNSSANGYCESQPIPVREGLLYDVGAVARPEPGYTAKLALWDHTNNAGLTSWSFGQPMWCKIIDQYTIPATCKEVTLRLQGVEAAAKVNWDCAVLAPATSELFDLPSFIKEQDQVKGACYFQDVEDVASKVYVLDREGPRRFPCGSMVDEWGSRNVRAVIPGGPVGFMPFLKLLRPCPDLAADTDIIRCDLDLAVAGVVAKVKEELGAKDAKALMRDYETLRHASQPREPGRWRSAYGSRS